MITSNQVPAIDGRGRRVLVYLAIGVAAVATAYAMAAGRASVLLFAIGAIGVGTLVVRRPVIGVAIYIVTFLFTYPAFLRGVGNFTINNILGLLFVPLVLLAMLREGRVWLFRVKPLLILAIITSILFGSGVFYKRSVETAAEGVAIERVSQLRPEVGARLIDMSDPRAKFVTRLVFLVFFVFFVRSPRDLRFVAGTIITCMALTYFSVSAWETGRLRVLGDIGLALYTGRNPNKLAYFALFTLSLIWYGRQTISRRWMVPLWLVALVACASVIPLTASRSGVLNLAVFLIVILVEGRFSARKAFALTAVVVAMTLQLGLNVDLVGAVIPEQTLSRLTRFAARPEAIGTGIETRGSAEKRVKTLLVSGRMIARQPLFGVGLGNYPVERSRVDPLSITAPPHNSYIWATVEGGLTTLALFLGLFGYLFRGLRRIERDYQRRYAEVGLEWLVKAMRTTLIGFMVFSFFGDMWIHVLFFIIVGMCMVLLQIHRTYDETGEVPTAQTVPVGI
ncbi:MAG: O-antigen ligase family protein [Candidatus Binatia bacterium]